ncbi:leiomodin-3 [Scleropages formosus]|uniref:leiomodin-3 n=1 Tax=Scleropages formosus TaxID=113540 RepID=UPI0010FA665C|nr:leiomodin-3 [Scleropages formosus]
MSNHSDSESYTDEIDEDAILANLSPEELRQLQSEMDVIAPDEQVPVGQRQKDQTEKSPTGSFDHRSLVDYLYWEKESKRMLEEERVPATLLPSEKNIPDYTGQSNEDENDLESVCKKTEEVKEEKEGTPTQTDQNNSLEHSSNCEKTSCVTKITNILLPPPEFADPQEKTEETSEPKDSEVEVPDDAQTYLVQINSESTERKNVTTEQKTEKSTEETEGSEKEEKKISRLKIPNKLALEGNFIKLTARPSGNDTNLESTLDKIRKNNPEIKEVNLNNIENIPKEMLRDYVNSLKKNKHVTNFSIANTGADENIAFALANMLRENRSITTLNIESNFITGKGIIAIMRCLQFNETLTELRFHNQRHMLGHHAEMEISRLLKANHTLLKMGYHFELPGPRMVVNNLLTRNLDRQRQRRHEEQRMQQLKEQKELMEMYENALNLPPGLLEMLGGYLPPMALAEEGQRDVSPEPSPPSQARRQLEPHPQPPSSDSGNPLKNIQLRKTPKRRDPFLELNPREEKSEERPSIQLRKTPRRKDASVEAQGDERANLKDVIKTLKPVPRQRQPPKVELTPRDQLLNEIRQSNVAYLKSVPLPKVLESRETSLF